MLAAYNIRFVDACRKMRIFYKKDRETGLRVYLLDGIASPFLLGRAVYLAPGVVRRDCELSCDERVIAVIGEEERAEYGKTLLAMNKIRELGISDLGMNQVTAN